MPATRARPVRVDTVVVGGGQGGLATAQRLRLRGREHVVLDAGERVGDSWRQRWDSLRLFTPAAFSHLPGLAFPDVGSASPGKDAVADYLVGYADRFEVSVEVGTQVVRVRREAGGLVVTAADARRWVARDVVVATGAHRRPVLPRELASALHPRIVQLHSSEYRRPDQLPQGPVLVVGAGNSGAEIALDLARPTGGGLRRPVHLVGRDVGHVPALGPWTYQLMHASGRPGSALSRRALASSGGAEPLGRTRPGELARAGVRRGPRLVAVREGRPVLTDGVALDPAAVVWCTGLRADHRFLPPDVLDHRGQLVHRRGVTPVDGLYVVGMPHQSAITSHLLGGVGRDAARVVDHLLRRA